MDQKTLRKTAVSDAYHLLDVLAEISDAEFVDRLVDAIINNDVSILLDLEGYSRSDDGDGVEH